MTTTSMIMSTMASSSTTSSPTATGTGNGNPDENNDDGGGRPLLFFVALGFGVVFTNLWIIVGVKYCFRYNRNRRAQIDDETGETIDLNAMPRQRRKREKKLMSMDEVNERFPLTKYKIWRATREQDGLPSAGGVNAPPSRAASIKETMLERTSTEVDSPVVEGDHPRSAETEQVPQARQSTDRQGLANSTAPSHQPIQAATPASPRHSDLPSKKTATATTTETHSAETPAAVEADEDPITTALPESTANELLQNPGDTCAICIDTLEDDDEIRGLTCGHAFHAGCLDPWLTSRRACCPLCKADYFVPKPRPLTEADQAIEDGLAADSSGRRRRARFMGQDNDTVQAPGPVFMGQGRHDFRSRRAILMTTRTPAGENGDTSQQPSRPRWGMTNVHHSPWGYRQRAAERAAAERRDGEVPEYENTVETPEAQTEAGAEPSQPQASRFAMISNRFRRNRGQDATPANTQAETTPSDLEAGTRS